MIEYLQADVAPLLEEPDAVFVVDDGVLAALRELVPAATAELTLKGGLPEGVPAVQLATVLPMAQRYFLF